MKTKIALLATLAALPMMMPNAAQAREYCREYTKTIYIGGKAVQGYGTACRQVGHDTWEISKLEGPERVRKKVREHIVDDLHGRYGAREVVVIERNHYTPPPVVRYERSSYYDHHRPICKRHKHEHKKHHYKHHHKHGVHYRGHRSWHNHSDHGSRFVIKWD